MSEVKKDNIYKTIRLTESYWPATSEKTLLESTVGQELRAAAAECPDRPALVEGIPEYAHRRRWTYAQLLDDAERIASALLARFKPGDHIAVWADNCVEWVLLEYGVALAGMVLVTVNPAYKYRELEYTIKQSDTVGLFLIDEYRGFNALEAALEVQKNVPSLKEIIRLADLNTFMNSAPKRAEYPEVKPLDPFFIIYTSGTTGVQKGSLQHNLGRLNCDFFIAERAGMEKGGVDINAMPLFHNGGCGCAVLGTLRFRGTIVIVTGGFNPSLVLNLFETEKGTFARLVPAMLEAILAVPDKNKYDLSSWKYVQTAGSFVEEQLVRRVQGELGCAVCVSYGQTESHGFITATHRDDSPQDQSATIGQPLPLTEVKIANPETGEVLPLMTDGEIWIRGYVSSMKYYNMPEATAKTVTPDGWLRTGDMGCMDERGFLRFRGRLKEMIVRGAENIYPAEVEALLKEHPKVADAAVVGVPHPTWEQEVAAVIKPRSTEDMPTAQELDAFCKENLTHFKRPRIWSFVSELPITASGKVQKFVLEDQIKNGELKTERT